MSYQLGTKSKQRLKGVHPKVIQVVQKAILYTTQDFSVHSGVRTEAEQRELVRRGASKTMNSMHRKQPDGFGHAVDLVPYINGQLRWEWEPIYHIAAAVHKAAMEVGLVLRWGAVWDRDFNDIMDSTPTADEAEGIVAEYVARRRAAGRSAFIDGPHYEIQ